MIMKFKRIPREYFATILDRLSRFEPAYIRYSRVFEDIINKFCLDNNSKKLDLESKIKIVEEIFNSSLSSCNDDYSLNETLLNLENKYFASNEISYQYLSSRLNISSMLNEIDESQINAKNLFWLKKINSNHGNLIKLRNKYSLLYPIEKIILCEGQTEFTLLNAIFKLFNVDLNKIGILVIPAGGKNQVARKYYSMIEYVKLPFFILLDKDASQIENIIKPKLRNNDFIYLIKSGEFEDLIPKKILLGTINYIHKNDLNCNFDDFNTECTMVENLENIYKKYGFGEFKKAQFALQLRGFIEDNLPKQDFINTEIETIVKNLG